MSEDYSNNNNDDEIVTVHAGCEITKKRKSSGEKKNNKKKSSNKTEQKLADLEAVGDSPAGKKGSKGAKGKGKKKGAKGSDSGEKGPKGPKRALSAYMYFAKDIRATIKSEQPELTFGELTKAIAARWALAGPEQKAPYEEMAAADSARYKAEKEAAAGVAGASTSQVTAE